MTRLTSTLTALAATGFLTVTNAQAFAADPTPLQCRTHHMSM